MPCTFWSGTNAIATTKAFVIKWRFETCPLVEGRMRRGVVKKEKKERKKKKEERPISFSFVGTLFAGFLFIRGTPRQTGRLFNLEYYCSRKRHDFDMEEKNRPSSAVRLVRATKFPPTLHAPLEMRVHRSGLVILPFASASVA